MTARRRRFAQPLAWLAAVVLCCAAPVASADYGTKPKPQPKPAAPVSAKPTETPVAAAGPKYYRYKGEKKGNIAGAQVMTLLVEDVFTGKPETLYVPNNDATSKTYDPLTSVAAAVKELEPGTIVQIDAEKLKGKSTVKSVAKADVKPGEELPNGYVFVQSAQEEAKGGNAAPIMVTLTKFGREVKVGVPMWKERRERDRDERDAKWEPDPKIDGVVRKLKAGDVVLAQIKPGKQPMLAAIYEYRTPERGKFIGVKEVKFNGGTAAGFEIEGKDGTAVSFTLEGTEQTKNNQTTYVPNPQQLRTVQKLKKGAEVEVHYRLDGTTWVMQQVTVLNGAEAKPAAASAKAGPADDAGTMKDDKAEKAGDEKKAEKPAKS